MRPMEYLYILRTIYEQQKCIIASVRHLLFPLYEEKLDISIIKESTRLEYQYLGTIEN